MYSFSGARTRRRRGARRAPPRILRRGALRPRRRLGWCCHCPRRPLGLRARAQRRPARQSRGGSGGGRRESTRGRAAAGRATPRPPPRGRLRRLEGASARDTLRLLAISPVLSGLAR